MVQAVHDAVALHREQILSFAQELVQIKSVTGAEAGVAKAVEKKMKELDFQDIHIDSTGNVIGRCGTGRSAVLFDAHMDTVDVIDSDDWSHDPFGGEIFDGKIYGRGSVDMKGALAISIYAVAIARDLGMLEHKSIHVAASVMEEDYDGVAVSKMLNESGIRPECAIFGEATDMKICRGHNGRALIEITVHGKAAHGSKPELGINPVYRFQTVISRIENLAHKINTRQGERGSLALTNVYCETASNNSVPQNASIILDRRLCIYEDIHTVESEMDEILDGIDAEWHICDIPGVSWTGEPLLLHSYLPAWEIPEESPLIKKAQDACRDVLGAETACVKLGYTTDAVATAVSMNIPSIIFGPGSSSEAHGKDEFCPVDELLKVCEIYVHLCNRL